MLSYCIVSFKMRFKSSPVLFVYSKKLKGSESLTPTFLLNWMTLKLQSLLPVSLSKTHPTTKSSSSHINHLPLSPFNIWTLTFLETSTKQYEVVLDSSYKKYKLIVMKGNNQLQKQDQKIIFFITLNTMSESNFLTANRSQLLLKSF